MGPEQAARLLAVGCNDMGGSIMNESITKAAGEARQFYCRCLYTCERLGDRHRPLMADTAPSYRRDD